MKIYKLVKSKRSFSRFLIKVKTIIKTTNNIFSMKIKNII